MSVQPRLPRRRIATEGATEQLKLGPLSHIIAVDRKLLPITDETADVSSLHLDVKNVRLHSELGLAAKEGSITEQDIEDKIWAQEDTKQLFQQILGDGGLIEPPFVRMDNVVAEGNRRLVCLRKMQNAEVIATQGITPEQRQRFEKIYIHRLPSEATNNDIDKLLLDWHVSSKKPWSKPDQTSLLYRLYDSGTTVEELARRTRESAEKMSNRLDAYILLLRHRERSPETPTKTQSLLLSHYREALALEDLRDWIQDEKNQGLFDGWVAKKQISQVKDTRDRLAKIIKDDAGLEMLTEEKMSVQDAFRMIGSITKATVFDRMEEWVDQIENITVKHIAEYKSSKAHQRRLKRLHEALTDLDKQLA